VAAPPRSFLNINIVINPNFSYSQIDNKKWLCHWLRHSLIHNVGREKIKKNKEVKQNA